jgi:hypothetical protein
LTRIEVRDMRFMSRFMARDYVTIREGKQDGKSVWAETSVGSARLKSAPAKVTRVDDQYRIIGAPWGGEIEKVEVRIDDGKWTAARSTTARLPNSPGRSGSRIRSRFLPESTA